MATQAEIAEHLDLTPRSVRTLISRGVFNKSGRGQLDIDACRIAYVRYLRERAAGRASDGAEAEGLDIMVERARLAKEQADHYAMKNAAMRGELVAVDDVTNAIVAVIGMAQGKLRTVPARIAKGDGDVLKRAQREIEDALEDLSAAQVKEEIGADGG